VTTKIITRAALLLALTLVFQSLRFIIPVTPFASTFIIGSLVNACLFIAVEITGLMPAVIIAVIAPAIAYFQQLLPLPVFIVPIAAGNILLACIYHLCMKKRWVAIIFAASLKALTLYFSFAYLLRFLSLPPKVVSALLFIMNWPQFATAVAGGVLAGLIGRRLRTIRN